MKIVLYTQRVEVVESYQERRDCADQKIANFLECCGYLPIPLSNVYKDVRGVADTLKPQGIVLTGGNSLERYGGNAPERDRTDRRLLEIAIDRGIPVYGFCRGMQSIIDYYGDMLKNVENHVAVRHIIRNKVENNWQEIEVNSYHNQGARQVKSPLRAEAWSQDGIIEIIRHESKPIYGTMWHPEREHPFRDRDIKMVQELFG